jgi:hypothetical protein
LYREIFGAKNHDMIRIFFGIYWDIPHISKDFSIKTISRKIDGNLLAMDVLWN